MRDAKKPTLYLVRPFDAEALAELVFKITGKQPTAGEVADAKKRLAAMQERVLKRRAAKGQS